MAESGGESASGERLGGQSELLGEMRALRRQARAVRHGYWFPLVLFGLLTCVSVPFYRQPAPPMRTGEYAIREAGPVLPFLGGYPGFTGSDYLAYYWMAALLGGLLLTQLWYWWHARRVGLATRARAYLITMAALTVAAIVITPLSELRSPGWLHALSALQPGDLVLRGTFPFVIIAASLLALAWAERSLALTITAVIYAGAALLASLYDIVNIVSRLGWNLPPTDQSLPNVLLPALVLIAGAAAAFAVRRHRSAT
jgi:hypothetical protein